MVVGCFECFGFLVKCMEASWLLEVVFADFSIYSCYLGHEFCYFGVPNLSFGRPAASILPPWGPFCQLGDTLRAMEGHMGAQNQILFDLG